MPPDCLQCGAEIPAGSAFCNRCGARQTAAANSAAAQASPAPAMAPARGKPPEPEEELWRGRYSAKSATPLWILCIAFAVVDATVALGAFESGKIRTLTLLAAPIPILYVVGSVTMTKLMTEYRLTNQRLFIGQGIWTRTLSELELTRVDDVTVRQNLLQRVCGVGDVLLATTDRTTPQMELVGIDAPLAVKEMIRNTVRRLRADVLRMESV